MDVVTGQPPDTARGAGGGDVLCCPALPLEPPGVRESAAVRWYAPEPPAQRSLRPFGASPRLCCIMEHRSRQGIVKLGDLLLAHLGYLSAAPPQRSILPTGARAQRSGAQCSRGRRPARDDAE
jgi:hypothetical protein